MSLVDVSHGLEQLQADSGLPNGDLTVSSAVAEMGRIDNELIRVAQQDELGRYLSFLAIKAPPEWASLRWGGKDSRE